MTSRRLGLTAALTVGPIAAWRFAQAYRARAGYPHRHAPEYDPGDLGLAFEELRSRPATSTCPRGGSRPRGGAPGPAVLLVHGWESARDRTLPNVPMLHASGLPRAHDRRPRPRREPARGAAADRRRVRRSTRRRASATCSGARTSRRSAILGPLDGRHRRAAGRRGGAARRRAWSPHRRRRTRTGSRARRSASPACRCPGRSRIRSPG